MYPKWFKKVLFCLIVTLFSLLPGAVDTRAQATRFDGVVQQRSGLPGAGVQIAVCTQPAVTTTFPCSPLATLYTNTGGLTQCSGTLLPPNIPGSPCSNPLVSDGLGNFHIYAANGVYTVQFNYLGLIWVSPDQNIGSAISTGAQTNITNTFTAPQNFDSGIAFKGPNPWIDIARFGGYVGPNYSGSATTCSITATFFTATCAAASDFANGHGILILGAGPAPVIATPQAPTVTPIFQVGSTNKSYCIADRDWAGGLTPCSAIGSTSVAPASMALQSYAIAGAWSYNSSTGVYTVTSAAHNMPTTVSGILSDAYSQIEIQSGTTNNARCEGAFSLSAVPSATTFQLTRIDLKVQGGTTPACSGGTMRIQPRIVLKWDSHFTYNVQSATCSGGIATITISPGIYGPTTSAAPTWVVPFFVNAIFSGVTDTHYNGTFNISSYLPSGLTPTSVQYNIGSCAGVSNVGVGGTMATVPGRAVKNHLIYSCTGASCALPANAANYSLVGVATGTDAYFLDRGWGATAGAVDLGDAPATAPIAAINQYLDTTIVSGGGTTSLTLAKSATNTVTSVNTFHDNIPNLLAACAFLPQDPTGVNSGRIIIPGSTSIYNLFPMMANFDMNGNFGQSPRNCNGISIEFGTEAYLRGTILMSPGTALKGGKGSTNCTTPSYQMNPSFSCIIGNAYPFIYWEPEISSTTYMENMGLNGSQPYQSGLYMDEELNGDGVTALRFENVHVFGSPTSLPVYDKTGFGRFWNFGGWSAVGGDFSKSRDYFIGSNCGATAYQLAGPELYIFTTTNTYSFGTFEVDNCGLSSGNFGTHVAFYNVLSEGLAGPAFKFNVLPSGVAGITINQSDYADPTGGFSTPYIDAVNSGISALTLTDIGCANSLQPILQTSSTVTLSGINATQRTNQCGGNVGAANYRLDNAVNGLAVVNNYDTQIGPGTSYFVPASPPAAFQSVTAVAGTGLPAGTYNYCPIGLDVFGNVTLLQLANCTSVTTSGGNLSVQFVAPVSFPFGIMSLVIYDQTRGSYANIGGCPAGGIITTPGQTVTNVNGFEACPYPAPNNVGTAATSSLSSAGFLGNLFLYESVPPSGAFTGTDQPYVDPNSHNFCTFSSSSSSSCMVTRAEQNIFLPGSLTSTWTGATWTADKAITVTRVQVQVKTAPVTCSPNAIVRITDGVTPINVTVSGTANDSGAISQNYAAGAVITFSVQTAAAGCGTSPADANVILQYRMQ